MKLVFLRSSYSGFQWFTHYYVSVFPQGRKKAFERYRSALQLISANPHIRHRLEYLAAREFFISRMPFSVIYRVTGEVIEVMQLVDNRAERIIAEPPSKEDYQ
jgi:hypothetical protein